MYENMMENLAKLAGDLDLDIGMINEMDFHFTSLFSLRYLCVIGSKKVSDR